MTTPEIKRRDFSKLTLAALGGLVSGTAIGCSKANETDTGAAGSGEPQVPAHDAGDGETPQLAEHACRGLNECKTADNDCRGQGACATKSWHHSCAGNNECKGQGGCGETALKNECKGQGDCAVPLMEHVWEPAREEMEAKWKAADLAFGAAPPKAE
jgi:hypothetical protein